MNRKQQPLVIANKHAVEELQVFLRAMSAAEKRWGKQLRQQENHVRRLMMVEDHCREELKRNVLRATHKNLKYLVNTDLLTSANQAPAPPPAETFLLYNIPAQQVSAFSVYAMSRLWADPERVHVPPMMLIADLQSTWAILPPAKRQVYEQVAGSFRAHLDAEYARRVAAEVAAESAAAAEKKKKAAREQRQQRAAHRIKAARRKAAEAATVPTRPKRQQQRCDAADTAAGVVTAPGASGLFASLPTAARRAPASSSSSSWEAAAFANFAKASRRHMLAALRGAPGGKPARQGRLSAAQWLPIAQAEWATKSTRQKRSFAKEGAPHR